MQLKPVYLTAEGKSKLEAELAQLRGARRREVAERIQIALESSDPVGNPEYEQAKAEQGFVEGRILTVECMLSNAVLIETNHQQHDAVTIGSEVVVRDEDGVEECYTIVGKAEANPRLGRISNESPIGRAMLDRHAGETVEIATPDGALRLTIVRAT
ncbi:MAG: transcription elongation factor GreA [Dehalococcoidales bacterium]|nr:transcription elongation factor GreA [Dehalococcoidales bacterium]